MKRKLIKSTQLFNQASNLIPRAAQTLSKAPDQFVQGVSPYALARGEGAYVWDVDGNKYLDLTCSLGGIVLGYKYPAIEKSVSRQRRAGTIFGLPGKLEVELALELKKNMPFCEMSRFGLNGSDVTAAAVRVSRAYTGRDHIVKCGYHGWHDWTISTNKMRNRGVPEAVKNLTHEFYYNDLPSLEKIFKEFPNQIAAVIMEPIDAFMPDKDFLSNVKKITKKNGAVFVFDELVTGFRLSKGGAAEYFGVEPDLVCYGKAISNGEPLSVLAGRQDIMKTFDDVFVSFTYAGFLPSIAAALTTIKFMSRHDVSQRLWSNGKLIMDGYNQLALKYNLPTKAVGYACHPVFSFKNDDGNDNLELKTLFLQETIKRGLLTNCKVFTSYAHNQKDIKKALQIIEESFAIMATALKEGNVADCLEGPVVRARYVRSD